MPGRGQPWKVGGLVDDTVTSEDIKEGTIALSDLESSLQATAGSGGHAIEDEGTPLTDRPTLNFVGSGVVASDDGEKTVVTVAGGGGYDEIQDEGTPLTQRPRINFIGTGVTAVDDAGSNRTNVTIPGSVVTELTFSKTSAKVVGNSDTIGTPLILARWAITNTLSTQNLLVALQAIAQGVGEVLAGGDIIKLSWGTSTDNGTTWTDDIRAFFTAGESAEEVSVASFQFGQPTDVALFLYGIGTNNGTVKGITALFQVLLPIGTTVTQTV
jgi:hypothetical protein